MSKEKTVEEQSLHFGWIPDYPDFRDYDFSTEKVPIEHHVPGKEKSVLSMLEETGVTAPKAPSIPATADLSKWCSEMENQWALGSCTAHAGIGLMEYYENKAFGRYIDASRLFTYKVTRNLLGWQGDTGAYLRTTMAAMALFGSPPEKYWPYTTTDPDWNLEPSAFCYSFAQNYQALQYFRLDPLRTDKTILLNRIKLFIAAKLPSMFGFTVYSSINQAKFNGEIPYPCKGDGRRGGHAVVAIGYDDNKKIKNSNGCSAGKTVGALKIRNSWGTGWGDEGYGWLPYEYILKGQAIDWWTLLKNEWINTGNFGL